MTNDRRSTLHDAGQSSGVLRRIAAALLWTAVAAVAPLHGAMSEPAHFPNRPIQLIVPYAPGGATDQTARVIAQGLEKRFGQPVLVINRPGASTTIGTHQVARSAPDGYTLAMVSLPYVSNISLMKDLPYAQSDFIPITSVTTQSSVLVVNPALPIHTLSDLIAMIKAKPGAINYGTFGIGSSAHLAALLFEYKIGGTMQAVHYRGGAPAAVGVMTGEVQMTFGTSLSAGGGIDAGKLRPIAVTSGKRLNAYPGVPTAQEQGLDYVTGSWFGILAPAHTPDPIVRQLYEATKATLEQPDVIKTITDAGNETFVTSPEEFGRFIAEETKLWATVLKGLAAKQQ